MNTSVAVPSITLIKHQCECAMCQKQFFCAKMKKFWLCEPEEIELVQKG